MKALILAAGRGVRLNEITEGLPKSLLDINGISLIQRQINQLKRNNICEIFVVRGFKSNEFHLEDVSFIEDPEYDKHDQLGSLIVADSEISGDLLLTRMILHHEIFLYGFFLIVVNVFVKSL